MKKFFANIKSLDRFTLSLDSAPKPLICSQCHQADQFVSHGFVYKNLNQNKRQTIGKRLFCSNRSGRSGCGRTCQLYIRQALPSLQYNTHHLFIFLSSLMASLSIQAAYQKATGRLEPRNAYRWLIKLQDKLIEYRAPFKRKAHGTAHSFLSRVRRLQLLLSSFSILFLQLNDQPCVHYQSLYQRAFI